MRLLKFPAETYELKDSILIHKSGVGILELIWIALVFSPLDNLKKKDHKTNKRLKAHVKDITRFKDKDEDARVSKEGSQELIIEEDEYELLQKHLEAHSFASRFSEVVVEMNDIVDSAQLYTPPKSET